MNLNIQIIEKCTYEVIFNLLNQIFNPKCTLQFENRSFELTVNQKCNNSVNCLNPLQKHSVDCTSAGNILCRTELSVNLDRSSWSITTVGWFWDSIKGALISYSRREKSIEYRSVAGFLLHSIFTYSHYSLALILFSLLAFTF